MSGGPIPTRSCSSTERSSHAVKTPTTPDVTTGILTALAELSGHPEIASGETDGVVDFRRRISSMRSCSGRDWRRSRRCGSGCRPPPRCRRSAIGRKTSPGWFAAPSSCSKAGTITTRPADRAVRRAPGNAPCAAHHRSARAGSGSVAIAAIFSPIDPSCVRSGPQRSSTRNAPRRL